MGPGMRQHDSSGWIFVAAGMSALSLVVGLVLVTARLGPVAVPIWAIAVWGLVVVGRGPIGTALAARIHPDQSLGDGDGAGALPQEVYAELDELRGRIAELEERQDFAERLLAGREASEPPTA